MAAADAWQKVLVARTHRHLRRYVRSHALRFCNECLRRTVATLVAKGKFEQAEHRISRLIASGLVPNIYTLITWSIRRAKPHLVDYLVDKNQEWFRSLQGLHFRSLDHLPLTLYPRFPLLAGSLAIVDVIAVIDILVKYGIKVLYSRSLIRSTTTPGQHLLVDCWRKYILDFSRDAWACRQQLMTSNDNEDRAFLAKYDDIHSSVGQALNRVLSSVACFPWPLAAICAAYGTTYDRRLYCELANCLV